ncbi:MAG: hypothetical protein PHC51_00590 [bacterium]|nr:hypothetical protein [bacterium]
MAVINDDIIGSAGALVAAAMETAGHYGQSYLLDVVNGPLGNTYGAFFYVVSGIIAIVSAAIGGKYKVAAWFLLGPPIVFFILAARVDSYGARWAKLNITNETVRERLQTESVTELNRGVSDMSAPARISWTFYAWARLTDSIVNSVANGIRNYTVTKDLDQVMRSSERLTALYGLQIEDPQLNEFIHLVTNDRCRPYLAAALDSTAGVKAFTAAQYSARLDELGGQIKVGKGDAVHDRINRMNDAGYFGSGFTQKEQYSCKELYDMSFEALRSHANTLIKKVADPQTGMVQATTGDNDSAEEWNTQLINNYERLQNKFGPGNIPTEEKARSMVNAVAIRLLGNAMSTHHPDLIKYRSDYIQEPEELHLVEDKGYATELSRLFVASEYTEKTRFVTLMLQMPYLQGALLYALSMTFPLFIMAMIIPGKHTALVTWMGYWFWAKSWDIGYAIVMLADDLFYYLLPRGPAMSDAVAADPGQAFQVMFRGDPTYSSYIYYHILAVLVGAIPVVSGIFIKGAGKEMVSGIGSKAEQLAMQTGKSSGVYVSLANTQGQVNEVNHRKLEVFAEGVHSGMKEPWVELSLVAPMALGQGGVSAVRGYIDQKLKDSGNTMTAEQRQKFGYVAKMLTPVGAMTDAQLKSRAEQISSAAKNYISLKGDNAVQEFMSRPESLAVYNYGVLLGWSQQSGVEKPSALTDVIVNRATRTWYAGYAKSTRAATHAK